MLERTLKRARQICPQIFQRLDADREPNESIGKTRLLTSDGIHGRVGHRRRVRDEALHASQGLGEREALQLRNEGAHRIVTASKLHTDDRPHAALLALRKRVAGM